MIARTAAAALVVGLALAGCSSSGSASGDSGPSSTPTGWQSPQEVLDAVTGAGFDCSLPSADTQGQILTKDPFTGQDLGGHSLVRCADFQIMLAKGDVDAGFAALVKCQVVPQEIRQSAEWTAPVIEGGNFLILPANLSTGWAKEKPGDFIAKFCGSESTFGDIYDRACAGAVTGSSAGSSSVPSSAASPAPAAS